MPLLPLAVFTAAASAAASLGGIPIPKRNACQLVSVPTVSTIVGSPATIQSQPGSFQISPGFTVRQVAISLCSYTFGTPSDNLTPTVSITYFVTATRLGASTEFKRIKSLLGTSGWRRFTHIGDSAVGRLNPRGGADFLTLYGNQFLQISLAATNVAAPLAKVKRAATRAAAAAWPRRN